MSILQNLFVGQEISKGKAGPLNYARMRRRTKEALAQINFNVDPDTPVANLGSGMQKIVEIARGLLFDCKLFILDEPTASFTQSEKETLFAILNTLRERGVTIIYISHHLNEIFEIADRVTVIRDGKIINTYDIENLTGEQLTHDMVGRDVSAFYSREDVEIGEVVFEARDISGEGVKKAWVSLRRGELVGIAGMVGSGRTEFADLLFGVNPVETGEIRLNGKKVKIGSPADAIFHNMCYIAENRQTTGLFLDHALVRNTMSASYVKQKGIAVNLKKQAATTKDYIKQLKIKTPGEMQIARLLSGGNQQKVVLSKWFVTNGDIFIFDEPTRGIDVGAKEEIYKIMTDLLKSGKSILMISSDMPELISMSDRIMVMREGEMVGELNRAEASEEAILKHSIGGI
jgi:ribose transport system ATP-binding protein